MIEAERVVTVWPSQTTVPPVTSAPADAIDRPDAWVRVTPPPSRWPTVDSTKVPVCQSYTWNGSHVNDTSTTATSLAVTCTAVSTVTVATPGLSPVVSALAAAGSARQTASAAQRRPARNRP